MSSMTRAQSSVGPKCGRLQMSNLRPRGCRLGAWWCNAGACHWAHRARQRPAHSHLSGLDRVDHQRHAHRCRGDGDLGTMGGFGAAMPALVQPDLKARAAVLQFVALGTISWAILLLSPGQAAVPGVRPALIGTAVHAVPGAPTGPRRSTLASMPFIPVGERSVRRCRRTV